jgi:hypothetical protein
MFGTALLIVTPAVLSESARPGRLIGGWTPAGSAHLRGWRAIGRTSVKHEMRNLEAVTPRAVISQ